MVSSGYGLFRQMTGVGGRYEGSKGWGSDQNGHPLPPSIVQRPEVVMEGIGQDGNWHTIHFNYKPTDLDEMPSFIAPLQPRFSFLQFCEKNHIFLGWIGKCGSQPSPPTNTTPG